MTVEFESPKYQFTEGQTVEVVITKSGVVDSEIVVNVTGGGFVVLGVFPAGSESPNNITISLELPDDNVALEPDQDIELSLSLVNPSSLVVVGLDRTTVTIVDDDGELLCVFVFLSVYIESLCIRTCGYVYVVHNCDIVGILLACVCQVLEL